MVNQDWVVVFSRKKSPEDKTALNNLSQLVLSLLPQFAQGDNDSEERKAIVEQVIHEVEQVNEGGFRRRLADGALVAADPVDVNKRLRGRFLDRLQHMSDEEKEIMIHSYRAAQSIEGNFARLPAGKAEGDDGNEKPVPPVPAQVQVVVHQDADMIPLDSSYPSAYPNSKRTPSAQLFHVVPEPLFEAFADTASECSVGETSFFTDVNWKLDFSQLLDEEPEDSRQGPNAKNTGWCGVPQGIEMICVPPNEEETLEAMGKAKKECFFDRKPAALTDGDDAGSTTSTSLTSPSTNGSSASGREETVLPQAPGGFQIVLVTMVCQVCSTPFQVHVLDVPGFQCTICTRGRHQNRKRKNTDDHSGASDSKDSRKNRTSNGGASAGSPGGGGSQPNQSNSPDSSGCTSRRTTSACLDSTLLKLLAKASVLDEDHVTLMTSRDIDRYFETQDSTSLLASRPLVTEERTDGPKGSKQVYGLIDERMLQYLSSPIKKLDPVTQISRACLVSDVLACLKRRGGSLKIRGRDGVWHAVNDKLSRCLVAHLFAVRSQRHRNSPSPTVPLPTSPILPVGEISIPTEIQVTSQRQVKSAPSFSPPPAPNSNTSKSVIQPSKFKSIQVDMDKDSIDDNCVRTFRGLNYNHAGSRKLREIIAARVDSYTVSTKSRKIAIIDEVTQQILEFFKRGKDGVWKPVMLQYEHVRKMVAHKFRDAIASKYKQEQFVRRQLSQKVIKSIRKTEQFESDPLGGGTDLNPFKVDGSGCKSDPSWLRSNISNPETNPTPKSDYLSLLADTAIHGKHTSSSGSHNTDSNSAKRQLSQKAFKSIQTAELLESEPLGDGTDLNPLKVNGSGCKSDPLWSRALLSNPDLNLIPKSDHLSLLADTSNREFEAKLDSSTQAGYCNKSAERWLSVRLALIGAGIAGMAAVYVTQVILWSNGGTTGGYPDSFASLAGLSLTYAITVTGMSQFVKRTFAQYEAAMNSCERVLYYSE